MWTVLLIMIMEYLFGNTVSPTVAKVYDCGAYDCPTCMDYFQQHLGWQGSATPCMQYFGETVRIEGSGL